MSASKHISSRANFQATHAASVTPSNSVDIPHGGANGVALFITGAGTLSVEMAGGETVTFTVLASQFLPIRVKRVNATGTTATGIIALW